MSSIYELAKNPIDSYREVVDSELPNVDLALINTNSAGLEQYAINVDSCHQGNIFVKPVYGDSDFYRVTNVFRSSGYGHVGRSIVAAYVAMADNLADRGYGLRNDTTTSIGAKRVWDSLDRFGLISVVEPWDGGGVTALGQTFSGHMQFLPREFIEKPFPIIYK